MSDFAKCNSYKQLVANCNQKFAFFATDAESWEQGKSKLLTFPYLAELVWGQKSYTSGAQALADIYG